MAVRIRRWKTDKWGKKDYFLRFIAYILYIYSKIRKLTFCEVYMLESDDTCTINARSARGTMNVASEYKFMKEARDD